MAKSRKKEKRNIAPDPVYNNLTVSRFINYIIRKGKKETARKIVYGAFEIIQKKTKENPLEVFETALKNAGPLLEVRPRRVGGATYQVPREVKTDRRLILAMRWIIQGAKTRKGKPMKEGLAEEILDAANNIGWAVKKRENTHRMAEANRAFAHFAW